MVICLSIISCNTDNKNKNNFTVFPVKAGNNWGFADSTGSFMQTPVYQSAGEFYNGFSLVTKGNKISYVSKKGVSLIPFIYNYGTEFSENLAFVSDSLKIVSCLDTTFKVKFTLKDIEEVHVFKEGLAAIRKNGKYGFIDVNGNFKIPCLFDAVLDFSEGKCGVARIAGTEDSTYYEWLYIDRAGKNLSDQIFSEVHDFKSGLAAVQKDGKYGWINKEFKFVFGNDYDECKDFSEGFAAFLKNNTWGLINDNGKIIVEPYYSSIGKMKEGLVSFSLGKNSAGFLDANGNIVIKPIYQAVSDFKNGFAYVIKNNRLSVMNKSGKLYFEDYFDSAPGFLGVNLGFIDFSMNMRISLEEDTLGFSMQETNFNTNLFE
jgi:hypothetical protein